MGADDRQPDGKNPFRAGLLSPAQRAAAMLRLDADWTLVASGAALGIAAAGLAFTQAHAMWSVIACGVALTLSNNIFSFAYHGYQPELFPTRVRAQAVGFVYSFSRLSTMFSAFLIAAILKNFGAVGVFVFIAGCMGTGSDFPLPPNCTRPWLK